METTHRATKHEGILATLVPLRLGTTLGLLMLWVGQLQFVSWSSRTFFDRWSSFAFAAICVVGAATLASAARSIRAAVRMRSGRASAAPGWAAPLDSGFLLFGLAYLLAALDDASAGGRLLDLDAFGSVHPASAVLEWMALVSFVWAGLLFAWDRFGESHRQLVLVAMLFCACGLAGEGIARAWILAFPSTQGFPTASTELWMQRYVELNAGGFRDRERDPAAPAGTVRVVVIGDSFAFGQGVDRPEDRVSDRLERLLADAALGPVEVLNVSAPYTHTLQHIGYLEQALEYRPDLVVLLYVFNDIHYLQDGTRPTMVTGSDGSLLARLNPMRALYENSYLYQQIHLRVRHLYWMLAPSAELPPDPYDSPELVQRHIEDLARFAELAAEAGVPVRIVPFNPRIRLETHRPRIEGFVESMKDAGLPVWPMAEAYGEEPYDRLIVNQMDHHPSARANRMLAEALLPRVLELLSDSAREGSGVGDSARP